MVHACSGVRASKNFHTTVCRIHMCAWLQAPLLLLPSPLWSLPPPVSPHIKHFFSNSNFCLRKKKLRPTKHTLPFVQKKEPSQVFLATHTAHIKAVPCCWNGTSIDNAIHTLQTQNRFLYNIVLDLYCFGHWALGREKTGVWSAGKRKVYTMYVTLKFPTPPQKVQVWTLQFYGQMKRRPPLRGLCALSGSHWNSGVNSWQEHWKKHYDLKRKTKSGLSKRNWKLIPEAILESLSLQRYTTTLPLTILSLCSEKIHSQISYLYL